MGRRLLGATCPRRRVRAHAECGHPGAGVAHSAARVSSSARSRTFWASEVFARIGLARALILVAMVLAATGMARGYGAFQPGLA